VILKARRGTSMRGRGVAGRGELIDARAAQRSAPRARTVQKKSLRKQRCGWERAA